MANHKLPTWCHWTWSWGGWALTLRAGTSTCHYRQPGHWAIRNPHCHHPPRSPRPLNHSCEADRPQSQSGSSQYAPVWPISSIYCDLHTTLQIISSIVYPTLSSLISGRGLLWLLLSPLNSLPSCWSIPLLICTAHLEFFSLMGFLDGFMDMNFLELLYHFCKIKTSISSFGGILCLFHGRQVYGKHPMAPALFLLGNNLNSPPNWICIKNPFTPVIKYKTI